ncbi:LemA family protein [Mycoplasma sp. 332]|uniref:LemA family protein n=1 Tax=Mycoplasma sp. 332 TaxID=3458236 RepID=UPI0040362BFC
MLFDSRTPQSNEGFKPNVDNSIKIPQPTKGERTLFIILCIITIGIILLVAIRKRNELLERMNRIQEASSLIQAAEKKRRATLIKQLDVVKGYAEYEQSTQKEIIKLRSQLVDIEGEKDVAKVSDTLNSVQRAINIQIEQYPNLKADRSYLQFQTEIAIQEDEIYATIRNYNAQARSFNAEIYKFWTNIVANKNNIYNQPLFQASEVERQDVDTSSLTGAFK